MHNDYCVIALRTSTYSVAHVQDNLPSVIGAGVILKLLPAGRVAGCSSGDNKKHRREWQRGRRHRYDLLKTFRWVGPSTENRPKPSKGERLITQAGAAAEARWAMARLLATSACRKMRGN